MLNHDSSPSLAVSGSTPHNSDSDCDVPASLLAWATHASWGEVWLTLRCSSGCHGAQATGSELANIGPQRADISLGLLGSCADVGLAVQARKARAAAAEMTSAGQEIASLPSPKSFIDCIYYCFLLFAQFRVAFLLD